MQQIFILFPFFIYIISCFPIFSVVKEIEISVGGKIYKVREAKIKLDRIKNIEQYSRYQG